MFASQILLPGSRFAILSRTGSIRRLAGFRISSVEPWCILARSGLPLATVEAVQAEQIVDRDPELFGEVDRTGRSDPVGTVFIFSNLLVADANQRAELDLRHPPRRPVMA